MENIENKEQEAVLNSNTTSNEQQIDADTHQDIIEQFCKKIPVTDLPTTTQQDVQQAIAGLSSLKEEIVQKKHGVLEKRNAIQEKVAVLQQSDKINIDEQEFKKSETSVNEYVVLLDKMIAEVERDLTFYQSFLSNQGRPDTVLAMKNEPDSFEHYITSRISRIKKYVKTVRRDLSISYSRYCYGFDAQIRQISFIEHVLHNLKNG